MSTGLYNYRSHGLVHLYAADEREHLTEHLQSLLDTNPETRTACVQAGHDLLRAEKAPARTLLRTAADSFERRDDVVLLGEQQVVFNLVLNAVAQAEQADTSWSPEGRPWSSCGEAPVLAKALSLRHYSPSWLDTATGEEYLFAGRVVRTRTSPGHDIGIPTAQRIRADAVNYRDVSL